MEQHMKIKIIRRVSVSTMNVIPPKGAVIEVPEDEGKALLNSGYVAKTNEALTTLAALYNKPGGNTPPAEGTATPADTTDYDAIVSGTVAEVGDFLAGNHGLDAKGLKALAKAESKGKDRAGVHAAIESAAAALDGGEG
jgi:hypothetical protein